MGVDSATDDSNYMPPRQAQRLAHGRRNAKHQCGRPLNGRHGLNYARLFSFEGGFSLHSLVIAKKVLEGQKANDNDFLLPCKLLMCLLLSEAVGCRFLKCNKYFYFVFVFTCYNYSTV